MKTSQWSGTRKINLASSPEFHYNVFVSQKSLPIYGLWRSLVARMTGGHEAAGSSPVSPTIYQNNRKTFVLRLFLLFNLQMNNYCLMFFVFLILYLGNSKN